MTDDTDKVHKALEARLVKRIEKLEARAKDTASAAKVGPAFANLEKRIEAQEEMVAKPGRRPKSS
jgi:BMFP domain-containing protein YqiC